jgi:hypothetical protein
MSQRAADKTLDSLHALIAERLVALIAKPDVSPQMLAQAIKFLKDNGVDTPASSPRISNLERALMELEPDEDTLREALRN